MTEHIEHCVYHFSLPRWMAQAIHRQAGKEDVQADGGSFRVGTPGEYEWETTGGAVQWWPRWGEEGEASLFATFYFRWGDQVEICMDLFTVEDEPECPWYGLPQSVRTAMARLAFWQLTARTFSEKVERYEQAITRDLPPSQRQEWNSWFIERFREAVQTTALAVSQVSLAEVNLWQALTRVLAVQSPSETAEAGREAEITELYDLLRRLVAWADLMGGWEAPVWQEAHDLLNNG